MFNSSYLFESLDLSQHLDFLQAFVSSKHLTLSASLKAKIIADYKNQKDQRMEEVLYGYMYGEDEQCTRDEFFKFVPSDVTFETKSATFKLKKEEALKFNQLRKFII